MKHVLFALLLTVVSSAHAASETVHCAGPAGMGGVNFQIVRADLDSKNLGNFSYLHVENQGQISVNSIAAKMTGSTVLISSKQVNAGGDQPVEKKTFLLPISFDIQGVSVDWLKNLNDTPFICVEYVR